MEILGGRRVRDEKSWFWMNVGMEWKGWGRWVRGGVGDGCISMLAKNKQVQYLRFEYGLKDCYLMSM